MKESIKYNDENEITCEIDNKTIVKYSGKEFSLDNKLHKRIDKEIKNGVFVVITVFSEVEECRNILPIGKVETYTYNKL